VVETLTATDAMRVTLVAAKTPPQPAGLAAKAFAITVEPEGGSPRPQCQSSWSERGRHAAVPALLPCLKETPESPIS